MMSKNFPNLTKDINLEIQKSLENPRLDKSKEIHAKTKHNENLSKLNTKNMTTYNL